MKALMLSQIGYSPLAVTVQTETTPLEVPPSVISLTYVVVVTNAIGVTGTINLQGSISGLRWAGWSGNPGVTVAANGVYTLNSTLGGPLFRYYRVQYRITGGSYTATTMALIKGESI